MSSSVGAENEILKKLHSDAMRGKWSEVFETCKQNRLLYAEKITGTGDTVLHMAVSNEQEKLVANMLNNLLVLEENIVLGAKNDRQNTPLHLAAVEGNVEMCKKIGRRVPSLIAKRNLAGETPLFLAALYGWKEAFLWLHYLYMESPGVSSTDLAHCIRDDNDTILHCAVAYGHFDVAIEIVHLYKDHLKEMMRRNKEGLSPLHFLAARPSAFKSTAFLERSFLERAFLELFYWSLKVEKKNQATTYEELQKKNSLVKHIKIIPFDRLFLQSNYFAPVRPTWVPEMWKKKEMHTWSLQIMNELLCHCSDEDMSQIISRTSSEQLSISLQREEFIESMATPLSGGITIDTPLMIAAKNGAVEMVERILELFPSRIKDVNAEGKNIVLLSVEYRQTEVFKFLSKQKWPSQSLFGHVDKEGNNALHLAASLGVDIDWFNPGEINWFEYVENSMPRGLSGRYNTKMKTPEDIFRESLKQLMRSEGKWVAKTSQACSVVSTLVLSVAFATRTSVPGGYDTEGGYAILRNNSAFGIFSSFSFVALFLSFMSTIIFLSIVVSRSHCVPSWRYITSKLRVGMRLMLFSIVCLWISFCAADSSTGGDLQIYIFPSFLIFLVVVSQLPTFFGPIRSRTSQIPARRRKATRPIEYRKTKKNNQDGTDLNH